MQPLLNIAVRAARDGGGFIVRKMHKLPDLNAENRASNKFARETTQQAETRIANILLKAYPDHSILTASSGKIEGGNDYLWTIDALVGSMNYCHGLPHFAVSIACQHHGRLQHAIIYDPLKQEIFAASKGDGATLNNRRIRVTRLKSIHGALLGTCLPGKQHKQWTEFSTLCREFSKTAGEIRQTGSTALDLAYVASGRLDGYWGSDLPTRSIAAGLLILREAGSLVSDYRGDGYCLDNGQLVAASPKIFGEMLRKIQQIQEK